MKYIKKYEENNVEWDTLSETPPNYKIGDKVVFIYKHSASSAKYGKKYTVSNIFTNLGIYYTEVKEIPEGSYYSAKFVSVIEYDAKKYNI